MWQQQILPQGSKNVSTGGCLYALSILALLHSSVANASVFSTLSPTQRAVRNSKWGGRTFLTLDRHHLKPSLWATSLVLDDRLRGGAKDAKKKAKDKDEEWDELVESEAVEEEESGDVKEAEEDADDEEEAEEEDISEDEYDVSEDEYDNEEEEDDAIGTEMEETGEYDEPLVASPMLQIYTTIGVMVIANKIDLYNPMVVRVARFAFIGYLVILQLFLLFVRIRAKAADDRTPVTVKNPLSNLVESQLQGPDNSNAMMKNLASSFLKSSSTVLEYDLKQARSMQGGLMFNMAFMWFLHFKMQQVQPLLINTLSGLTNMYYSPLFQVYVMGRNLERPFVNPAAKKFEDAAKAAAEATTESEETTIDDDSVSEEEEEASEDGEEEEASEDGEESEEDDDGEKEE